MLKREGSKVVLNRRADNDDDGVVHRVRGSGQMLFFFFCLVFFVFFFLLSVLDLTSFPFSNTHPSLLPSLCPSISALSNLFLNKKKNLVQNKKALKMIVRQYFDTQ